MPVSEPVAEIPDAQATAQPDNGLPVSDDDAFAWLESLAAKQGAKPEELLTKPEDRPVDSPDWLGLISEEEKPADLGFGLGGAAVAAGAAMAAGALFDDEPAEETISPAVEPEIFTGQPQPVEPSVLTPAEEMSDEDAFSWLESLAAKQGAKPEELLTKPEDRADSAPTWALMGAAAAAAKQEPEIAQPEAEALGDLTWLQSISSESPIDETTIGEQPFEETLFTEPVSESIFEEKPVADATMASAASADEVAEWLHQLDVEDTSAPAAAVQQPAYTTEELPDWLKDEEPAELPSEELPDWLKGEGGDQPVVVPAQKPEWTPEQPQIEAVFMTAIIDNEPEVKEMPVVVPAPVLEEPAPAKPVKVASAEKDIALYENSKLELERGNLPEATQGYRKLIKKGKMLEEIIFDLREAQYRFPVDVVIWQTLGDAYMRANRLQDALDAYTKAEELLR